MDTLKTRLAVHRLHPHFVAEVTGIDLTVPIPREDFRAIWEAFNEHQILVFRDQQDAITPGHAIDDSAPERLRPLARERVHEAHRRSARHARDEHLGERGNEPGGLLGRGAPHDNGSRHGLRRVA